MAIYKIFPNKDSTIYSKFPTVNAGRDEVLEVTVKNSVSVTGISQNVGNTGVDDIRRSLISFASDDLDIIKSFNSQSFQANLRLFLANAENLSQNYTIECYPVSQDWIMGTGKFSDSPSTENGVCWKNTGPANASPTWDPNVGTLEYLFTTGGGSWNANYKATQSFDYTNNKDLNIDVTNIVNELFTGSINDYGFIIKHSGSVELNTGSYIDLKYFSVDTHTIYPPCLEYKWNDYSFNTGSNNNGFITTDNFVINVGNNLGEFKKDTKYNFNIKARDKFPTRQFTTSSIYLNWKYLPTSSYWGIQDLKTTEMIVDFDEVYTKISANTNGNYFTLYMNGLQPERTYKLLIKADISGGEEIVVDEDILFKIVR
jgi:hypothetical protein